MIKLVTDFLNSLGKKHKLSIKDPNTDLSPAEIKQSLELLTTLDIFEKDGVGLFQEVVSAKYVETIETPVFVGEEFFGEANQPMVFAQPMLGYAPAAPVMDVPEVTIEEKTVEEVDEADKKQKLEELKSQSTYKELPAVPQVSLDKPKEGVKAGPETNKVLEERTPGTQPETDSHSYNLIMEMRRRRNRRKAKEKQKKNPD
ncbi:DUF2922 domain-containing protein [Enterococcus sp. 669A]|uniref:DUF2922 domain-containing protein n=1 Tax=Candidatus Enterococcus moelleringii TaxID=2815325 RepID=A0ABS3LDW4_9ENTE|nr:DUF2922 domain-containing protein [Enterococcus sp. 669A]MBO1307824.1 DUF2922 domain-containing protein [Enterococcus sp. 669A]